MFCKQKNIIFLTKTWKYLFAIHELWKKLNISLQYMNYTKMYNMNYENMKMFVCNTWIMKKLNISLQYMNYTKMYNMNYENRKLFVNTLIMKMFVSDTWIMKTV